MNGLLLIPPAPLSRRERMASVLGAWGRGLTPPLHCTACRASLSDRCVHCGQADAEAAAADAGADMVDMAPDEDTAKLAALECTLGLLGISAGEAVRLLGLAGAEVQS